MTLRRGACLAMVLAGALAGCALIEEDAEGDAPRALSRSGYALAQTRCVACHAIEGEGPGPNPAAPAFVDIARRYRGLHLDWELEAISEVGHYRMPARALTKPEVGELTAYIRRLDRKGRP